MRLAGPGDVTVPRGLLTRLANARIEAQVADELARTGEPGHVADHGRQCQRGDRADSGDRHQVAHIGSRECLPGQLAFDELDLGIERVVQAQVAVDLLALMRRQRQFGQPLPAALAEHVGHRRLDQIARQDRVDLVA